MGTGKARPTGATRRAILVVGGVALLVGYSQDPSPRPVGVALPHDGRPVPAPRPALAPHPAPAPHSTSAPPARIPPARTPPARTPPARTPPARTPSARARLARTRAHVARRRHRGGTDLPMIHVDAGRKGIALTIDDGPSPVYTPQVLRLLDRYRVTATFSMIGLQVAADPGLVREVAAAGHRIANHTWSHLDLAVMPPVVIADQINRATDAIHQATGQVPTLFRAPYGAWSPAVLQHCAQTGMTPLDWSVDPRDWSRPGVASIVSNIMRNTRTGSIILEHDGGGDRAQTVAALKIVLPRLLAAGYHFTTP